MGAATGVANGADAGGGSLSGPFWPHALSSISVARVKTGMARPWRLSAPTLPALFDSTMRRSMTDSDYHARADDLLRRLEVQMDDWLQADVIDIDAQRTGGLLELCFPNGSKIVINKQPPLHEIWLASRAGGFHFGWDGATWRDSKSGEAFEAVFGAQASGQAGRVLALST